jgi:hypothetical protein
VTVSIDRQAGKAGKGQGSTDDSTNSKQDGLLAAARYLGVPPWGPAVRQLQCCNARGGEGLESWSHVRSAAAGVAPCCAAGPAVLLLGCCCCLGAGAPTWQVSNLKGFDHGLQRKHNKNTSSSQG